MVDESHLVDPSGEPIPPTRGSRFSARLARVSRFAQSFLRADRFLALLGLVLVSLQLIVMRTQNRIIATQTEISRQQLDLADFQQRLATRPNVELVTGSGMQVSNWHLTNHGPYKVVDVRQRDLHFRTESSGWQVSTSSGGLLEPVIGPGKSVEIEFANWLAAEEKFLSPPTETDGLKDFVVIEFQFKRETNDREYLLLQPVVILPRGVSWIVRPEASAMAGDLKTACGPEAFTMELLYMFYRRNPLPYPAELYNFHYLLGNDPGTGCLSAFRGFHP
jgi:hypothetical protein